jgi:hypothetical protein
MSSLCKQQPKLIQLKDLRPLRPWKTPPLALKELRGMQYVKLKKPVFKDGVQVYWLPKYLSNEVEEPEAEIPYQGVFEFIDRHFVSVIKRWIDKFVGQVSS